MENFRVNEPQQLASWRETVASLQLALSPPEVSSKLTGMLLEFSLLRLSRRIDVILLRGDVVVVVEVKGGEGTGISSALAQVEDYALCLRDFHEPCRGLSIVPVAGGGPDQPLRRRELADPIDDVTPTLTVALSQLDWVVHLAGRLSRPGRVGPTLDEFDRGAYNPTPTIVEAARDAYSRHGVEPIRRSDASGLALEAASQRLAAIVERARSTRTHRICFITGTPGAGKTLLGLDLVLARGAGTVAGVPAALLSGNRPLVKVLQQALIDDEAKRTGVPKREIGPKVEGALQTLLGYLKTHAVEGGSPPPEHVVVFDEAQRAWDAETGLKLLGRKASEPQLFLETLGRLPWTCLVCLVGGGQEINRGELGLPLWVDALIEAGSRGAAWEVHGAAGCLVAGRAELGMEDLVDDPSARVRFHEEPALQLEGSMRAYRNADQSAWLAALLEGRLDEAAAIAARSDVPPAHLCRELRVAKSWLAERHRGGRRLGLLASSGAVRLRAEGLPPSPMSNQLGAIAHWFLKPSSDFRSSDALETPLSEYAVQGLEIDYAGVCWGGDLIWENGWVARKMRAPKWTTIRSQEARQHRLNSYRVLLSRSREGQIIYLPRGSTSDPTRSPQLFDAVAEALLLAGCRPVPSDA